MPTRLLHISDLHTGSLESPDVERALVQLIKRVDPELVVASGDLTNRGRRSEHERAAALLRRLEKPLVVVPGNHDIPYTFPARSHRLGGARPRPAAPETPRRGPRPSRLRDRRRLAGSRDVHLARDGLGAHRRAPLPARTGLARRRRLARARARDRAVLDEVP